MKHQNKLPVAVIALKYLSPCKMSKWTDKNQQTNKQQQLNAEFDEIHTLVDDFSYFVCMCV